MKNNNNSYPRRQAPDTHPYIVEVPFDPAHLPKIERIVSEDDRFEMIDLDKRLADAWKAFVGCASERCICVMEDLDL